MKKEQGNNMSDITTRVYQKGEIIFGEGSYQPEMYEIQSGLVGIYKDYGKSTQVKLAEIRGEFFGEMGLIENADRSATAVALIETSLVVITRENMNDYFMNDTYKIEGLLQTMAKRINNLDTRYMEVCACIDECVRAAQEGLPRSPLLLQKMKLYSENV